jgi:hypothetical protein
MDAGGISVVRQLPIDPALVNSMFLGLRRDTPGSATGWSLGRRGSAEVDIDFFRTGAPEPTWTATARLWDPEAVAVVRAVVDLTVTQPDGCELTIRPNLPLSPWWSTRMPALLDLARAALDELAEELLWHATRDGLASHDLG